jgi:hypothetical protein
MESARLANANMFGSHEHHQRVVPCVLLRLIVG